MGTETIADWSFGNTQSETECSSNTECMYEGLKRMALRLGPASIVS